MRETTENGESSILGPDLRVLLGQLTPQPLQLTRKRTQLHFCFPYYTALKQEKKGEGCPSHADTELGCHYLGTSLSHCERDGKMGFEQMQITTLFLITLTESSNLDSQNGDTTVKS